MKSGFVRVTACLAFCMFFCAAAIAQERKETHIVIIDGDTVKNTTVYRPKYNLGPRDSITKSMSELGDEMRKVGDEIRKNIRESFNEAEMKKLEAQLKDMSEEMEKLGEELEEDISKMDFNIHNDREDPEAPESPEEPGNSDTQIKKDKDKSIAITDDGIFINMGGKKAKKRKVERKKVSNNETDWFLLDLGVNTFTNNNSFQLPASADPLELNLPKSVNVTFHLFRTGVNLYRHHVYTTFGLAYDMHDYRLTKNTTFVKDTNRFAFTDAGTKLTKNKLTAQYITLPVMLHFETNPLKPNRSFKLGIGGWGGILASSYQKQKSEERGKQHLHDDYNLNNINYGLRGQIGYGAFTLYSQYALSPLFKSNVEAPELNPVTFGVILHGFKWN